jgi:methyltransferase
VVSTAPGLLLVSSVAAARLVELWIAGRHAAWARAQGGVEHGRGHYPFMVALHVGILTGSAVEPLLNGSRFDGRRFGAGVLALVAAHALRWWTIATLGRRWTTRVIVLPGWPLVAGGPFRYLRHPNYLAVAIEVAALPLACGAWVTLVAGSILNAVMMAVRIPCEERALGLRAGRP